MPDSKDAPAIAAIVAEFQQAVAGLDYPSESDYPFQVLTWTGTQLTPADLGQLIQQAETAEAVDRDRVDQASPSQASAVEANTDESSAGEIDAGKPEELGGSPEARPVEVRSLAEWFQPLTQPQDWHSQPELDRVQQFQQLRSLLSDRLTDLQVYRIGEIEIDVLIVGKMQPTEQLTEQLTEQPTEQPTPVWIVLATTAIET